MTFRAIVLALLVAASALLITSVTLLVQAVSSPTLVEPEPIPVASLPEPAATRVPVAITSVDVPILMYHHLDELGPNAGAEYEQLSVAPNDFRQQLDYLQENGYQTITFAELVGAFEGQVSLPDKPVIITFDDGWDDVYHVAYPMLQERGMSATFFIATNWIENLDGVVSWAQIEEMSQGGMEFGSHSVTHPYLTTSEADWMEFELEQSKATLEERTGKPVTALAYPFGLYDDRVINAVREAGYRTACSIDQGWTVTANDLLTLPRLWVYGWTSLDDFAAVLTGSG